MPEPRTVWAVEMHLGVLERKGTLSLEPDALRFSPASSGREIHIPFTDVAKVRRLRGSPVLLIVHTEGGQKLRTAFYFVEPPPIGPLLGKEESVPERPSLFPRNTRRRARRQNVGYLSLSNRVKKEEVLEWERALREALDAWRERS
jgi:hypothetical protein